MPSLNILGITLFLALKQLEHGFIHLPSSAGLQIVWSHISVSSVCLHKHVTGLTIRYEILASFRVTDFIFQKIFPPPFVSAVACVYVVFVYDSIMKSDSHLALHL
jgi:hypothetical protein